MEVVISENQELIPLIESDLIDDKYIERARDFGTKHYAIVIGNDGKIKSIEIDYDRFSKYLENTS